MLMITAAQQVVFVPKTKTNMIHFCTERVSIPKKLGLNKTPPLFDVDVGEMRAARGQ